MVRNRELLETHNSILSLIWGVVFFADYMFDGNLYNRFPDTYHIMRFLPSWVWGCVYGGAGIVHLASMFFYRAAGFRKQILFIKAGLWVFLGYCIVNADKYAANGWCCFAFAGFALILFVRFSKERAFHDAFVSKRENPLV